MALTGRLVSVAVFTLICVASCMFMRRSLESDWNYIQLHFATKEIFKVYMNVSCNLCAVSVTHTYGIATCDITDV